MHFEPSIEQSAIIRHAIEAGRIQAPEDALKDAMQLWETRERMRFELSVALQEAETNLLSGQYRDYSDASLPQLAEELKAEARINRNHG